MRLKASRFCRPGTARLGRQLLQFLQSNYEIHRSLLTIAQGVTDRVHRGVEIAQIVAGQPELVRVEEVEEVKEPN